MARRRKKAKKSYKICQHKSGAKKGKLKKGWKYGKRGSCVRAKRG